MDIPSITSTYLSLLVAIIRMKTPFSKTEGIGMKPLNFESDASPVLELLNFAIQNSRQLRASFSGGGGHKKFGRNEENFFV